MHSNTPTELTTNLKNLSDVEVDLEQTRWNRAYEITGREDHRRGADMVRGELAARGMAASS